MSVPASCKVAHMKAHRTLGLDDARRLIGEDATSITRLTGASGSDVFAVDTAERSLVVKLFPTDHSWKLRKELHVYELLDERSVDVPAPRVVAAHPDEQVLVLERVDGLSTDHVTDADAPQLYRELGRLLARLHTIELEEFGYLLADGVFEPRPTNLDYMRSQFGRRLAEFAAHGGDAALGHAIAEHVADREELLVGPGTAVLCHNDCHEGNVVVSIDNDRVTVTGWFDFENAVAADPLLDLAKTVAYSGRDRSVITEALAEGYGVLPPNWRDALDLYGLFHVLELWTWFASLGERKDLAELDRSLTERLG